MMTIEPIIKAAEIQMAKSIEALKREYAKLRTGRAHPSLLEHIRVECYGSEMPLSQVANVNVTDARTLSITPWDKTMVPAIEKAILNSDLGLNPATAGQVIRVPLPPLTEERRRDLTKVVHHEAEEIRVAIRNARRDANNQVKQQLKDKKITEDDEKRANDNIQKLTDKFIAEVDKMAKTKEAELMAV